MSGYRRVNYYELCRLCTSNKGTKVHLFKGEGKRRQIPTKIQICLHLQVSEQDSLPKLICNLCLDKLEGYFDFRSSCVKAEAMLESYAKNLSLNTDFVMDGKVYIKENKLDNVEEDISNKEVLLNNVTQVGRTIQLKKSEIKVSSQTNEIVTLPVSFDNIGGLVQAATIHILPEKELAKLQNNLKSTIQVQQNIERITGEHSYSYNVQEQTFVEEPTQNQNREQNVIKNTVTSTCTQMEKDELLTQPSDIIRDATQDKCRNSINQIGEFLKLKTVSGNEETVDYRCENCGIMFTSLIDKTTHSDTCTAVDGQLKIEPVVMLNVQEDRTMSSCGPFSCDDCAKIFKRKENLVQHRRLHTGERPFRCSQCPSTFSRKEHLGRHVVCHTGEKHYSCGICGKLFGRKDNVGKHSRIHHQVKTLLISDSTRMKTTFEREDESASLLQKCNLCDKQFATQDSLQKHITLRHTDSEKCNIMLIKSEEPVSILEKALKQIPELCTIYNCNKLDRDS